MIPRNTSSQRRDAVKLDFESMRIQKSYHRADVRRLSTESYVKEQDNCLATQWLWYRKEESGHWVKYGEEVYWNDEMSHWFKKWPKSIFSLPYQFTVQQTSDKNNHRKQDKHPKNVVLCGENCYFELNTVSELTLTVLTVINICFLIKTQAVKWGRRE